jgi:hypothetical protein
LGLNVTICIAAKVHTSSHIAIVTDRRISFDDLAQAADDATTKAFGISPLWGMSFAADDATCFLPIYRRTIDALFGLAKTKDVQRLNTIRDTVCESYRHFFEAAIIDTILGRYGFKAIDEFRQQGLCSVGLWNI